MTKKSEPPALPASFLLIREGTAPKMGVHAEGLITYQILTDPERRELFIRLTRNVGGGYFSREIVPLASIVKCTERHAPPATFRVAVLAPAFQGRSINNRSFLAAALIAEGLLARDPDIPHELIDAMKWNPWMQACRAVSGELPTIQLEAPTSPEPGEAKPKKASSKVNDARAAG